MPDLKHGMLWVNLDDAVWEVAEYAIQSRGHFTRVIDSGIAKEGRKEPAFIGTPEAGLVGLALATSGNKQGVRQRHVRFSHFRELSVSYDALEGLWDIDADFVPPHFGSDVVRVRGRRGEQFLKDLIEIEPRLQDALKSINGVIASSHRRVARDAISEIETFERDAIASALEVWGGGEARKRVLSDVTGQPTDTSAPFLSQLREVRLREDAAIIQDLNVFPGFDPGASHVVGAVELEAPGEKLTIVNCNRTRVEENLGVDLIYYSHRFDSFVMVQYKSLRREGKGRDVYRPQNDRNVIKEIKAMGEVLKLIKTRPEVTMQGFRLYNDPFFFKLCKSTVVDPLSTKMSYGIYLPLSLWDSTCQHAKGPRGAIALTWDGCPRKMSREEFVRNVRNGWIGSPPKASNVLQRLVQQSLIGKKLLVCAATSPAEVGSEQPRDDMGRFTAADDPLATN